MTQKDMTPEQKLQALFAASSPPENDYGFEIAVLERLVKQRAINRFTHLAMRMLVAGGLLVAMVWAVSQGQVASLMPLLSAAGACALAGLVIWTLRRAAEA